MHNKQVDHGDNSKILALCVVDSCQILFPPNFLFKEHVERETRGMSKRKLHIHMMMILCSFSSSTFP